MNAVIMSFDPNETYESSENQLGKLKISCTRPVNSVGKL